MSTTVNILMTCIGRRVSLLQSFRRALAELGLGGRIYGSDWSRLTPAFYVTDESFLVPGINAPEYVDVLLDICRQHDVGLVIPLLDPELLILARARERFAQAGARLVLSSLRVVEICRDKLKTFQFLRDHGLGTPRVLSPDEALGGPFPLVVKERRGSSARNVRRVHHAGMLKFARRSKIDFIIQEYVPGVEFTVDVYADFTGRPRVAVPRQRLQVRTGEVTKARTVRDPDVIRDALRLVEALGECVGVITAQCRRTPKGEVKFFDINPRFGGGVPLAIRAGADFPKWILQEHLGQTPSIDPEAWENGLLMLRYDAEVFHRLDEAAEADESVGAP